MTISYQTEVIKGRVAQIAVLYALVSYSSMVVGGMEMAQAAKGPIERNARAFEALPKEDTRRKLDEPQRAKRWSDRHPEITREIAMNRQLFWDWVPFMGYRHDLMRTMDLANIAILPNADVGKLTSLYVGQMRGCLLLDWGKASQASADDARVLLDAFNDRSAKAYDYQGIYVLGQDGKVAYTPAANGAEIPCPAWQHPKTP